MQCHDVMLIIVLSLRRQIVSVRENLSAAGRWVIYIQNKCRKKSCKKLYLSVSYWHEIIGYLIAESNHDVMLQCSRLFLACWKEMYVGINLCAASNIQVNCNQILHLTFFQVAINAFTGRVSKPMFNQYGFYSLCLALENSLGWCSYQLDRTQFRHDDNMR